MAAYAALVSLMNTIDQIQNHPRHSFSFDKHQISSLWGKTIFFLEFVESYNSHGSSEEVEDLELRIANTARMAEVVLESDVVDQVLAGSSLDHGDKSSSFLLDSWRRMKVKNPKGILALVKTKLKKVIIANSFEKGFGYSSCLKEIETDMHSIMEKVEKLKEESRVKEQQPTDSMLASSSTPLTRGKDSTVGFDGYMIQLMDVLTGQQSTRKIISVVGMGGIGKTTLARNVYEDLVILEYFDIRAWVTVSQEYNIKQILLELLSRKGQSTEESIDELGTQLYKKLSGRRYLIIFDDIWSSEVWDMIGFFFPDNGNGSRIVITTRLSNLASHFSSSSLVMNLLDEEESWKLFCEKTFGEEVCPLHLVNVGKRIVKQCKGLPLSIVVIGGHLRKSSRTTKNWVKIASNMISFLNSVEDQSLSILSLSYSHLPTCLKPCFLYFGIFPEDKEILGSTLIKFWVAEGFLRPDGVRTLEEIAEGYLNDLVDRNLILVHHNQGQKEKMIKCSIHDLLRELCLKIAGKEKFFCLLKHPEGASRCMCGSRRHWHDMPGLLKILPEIKEFFVKEDEFDVECLKAMFQHLNLRYICGDLDFIKEGNLLERNMLRLIRNPPPHAHLPSTISLHWSLQTIVICGLFVKFLAPFEIWEMPQLRHLDIHDMICLPDPPPSDRDGFIMRNLQTLLVVEDFRPSEEVCRRIPNIKELEIYYNLEASSSSEYCQHNLGLFHKLESLKCEFAEEFNNFNWRIFKLNMKFPSSLQELCLGNWSLDWEDLSMIGSLPHLKDLKLTCGNSDKGSEWSPVEGEFLRLTSLTIYNCDDLVYWHADRAHFPVLENLTLGYARELAEFPSGIGEIPTLQHIKLDKCSVSAAISAVRILVEQEELGNDYFRLEVQCQDVYQLDSARTVVKEEGLESKNLRLFI